MQFENHLHQKITMVRLIFLILYFTSCYAALGQHSKETSRHTRRIINGANIKSFIDSLKIVTLNDTVKFSRNDLINLNGETENTKSYSLLFLIDSKYAYRLDIIKGSLVVEFINEILHPSKIEEIIVLDRKESMPLFGPKANNGSIIISMKKKSKINYKVGGLNYYNKRKSGNNFKQKGEIMLRS